MTIKSNNICYYYKKYKIKYCIIILLFYRKILIFLIIVFLIKYKICKIYTNKKKKKRVMLTVKKEWRDEKQELHLNHEPKTLDK